MAALSADQIIGLAIAMPAVAVAAVVFGGRAILRRRGWGV